MKKILVPVDLSEHTETVCRFALEIIKKSTGELRLFHSYFDYVVLSNSSFPYSIDSNEMFNQEMMTKIREEALVAIEKIQASMEEELKRENVEDVKIEYTLTGGLPEEEILNISNIYQPDLIVMGTRGKGEKDILTGKVSNKVVKNAQCRILTVPRNAIYNGFRNMMYATNFNDEDFTDLQKLFDLLVTYKPVVHCVHINIDRDRLTDETKMNSLKKHFYEKMQEGRLIFEIIDNDDFLQGVNDYVKNNHIDSIAVVHHRKGFIKSLFTRNHTRELLYHSDIPLYIFPGQKE